MKILIFSLSLLFVGLSGCTKDQPKSADTGTVGKGMGGQTVGTPFAGSVGAGNNETRGSNVGQSTPGQR